MVRSKIPDDFLIISDIAQIRALAEEGRLAMITLLNEGQPMTGSMVAEKLGLPANRVQYHLLKLLEQGLIREVWRGRKRWKEERFFEAAARHFVVDPGLACSDSRTASRMLDSIRTIFSDWRRREVLGIDYMEVAHRIIHDALRVKNGEKVLVMFGPDGFELAEAIAVELAAAGANPRLRFWSRHTVILSLDRHNLNSLSQLPFLPAQDDDELDAGVYISSTMPQGDPPTADQTAKLPLLMEAVSQWQRSMHRRRVRYVDFTLPQRGEFDGSLITPEESLAIYWRSLAVAPQELASCSRHFLGALRGRGELHLTSPLGTDFRVDLDIARPHVSDGLISEEDVRSGRSFEELPAGAILFLPIRDTARGTFVGDYTMIGGVRFYGVRVRMESGKIAGIDAANDAEILRRDLESTTGDGGLLATVRFGINPACPQMTGKLSLDICQEGGVTLTFGNNELLGGDIRSTIDLVIPASNVTVSFGETQVVRDGRLLERPIP